jgi:uncharacterized Zn finger protein
MSETVVERAADKARRLLQEGRLMVIEVNPNSGYVLARCRGDSGLLYDLGHDHRSDQWRCTCEARGECSHLQALKLVVVLS